MENISLEQAMQRAAQHQRAGQRPDADAIYQQVIAQKPRDVRALYRLAVLAQEAKRFDVAESFLRHAITIAPAEPELHAARLRFRTCARIAGPMQSTPPIRLCGYNRNRRCRRSFT